VLDDPTVRRVAIVRLRIGLGDLLCSLPSWRALRRARPDLGITVVTYAETRHILDRMRAWFDELLPFPGYPGIPERPPHVSDLPVFQAGAAARRFDLAVQAYGDNPAANAVCDLLEPRFVGGFAPVGWAPARDVALHLPYPRHLPEIRRHLRLFGHLGVPVREGLGEALEFPVTPADEEGWRALSSRYGLPAAGYVVVHPGATSPSRRWPPHRFARVADALASRGLRVVIGGVAGERTLAGRIRAGMAARPVDLAGRTTLGEYAVALRHAALLITNDTGAAHLAAAVGGRSVTVFLSGDPVRWAHGGVRHRAVRPRVACAPCSHLRCPIGFPCADDVTVGDVLAQAAALLP
jgi:ADP-heptose:LPS heptosyltransferase